MVPHLRASLREVVGLIVATVVLRKVEVGMQVRQSRQ